VIIVYYNGVALKDCVVKRFQQEQVYDESRTNPRYDSFVITVECTLVEAAQQDAGIGSQYDENHFAYVPGPDYFYGNVGTYEQLRKRLIHPRGDFYLIFGAQNFNGINATGRLPALIATGQETYGGSDTMPDDPGNPTTQLDRENYLDQEAGPHVLDVACEQIWGGKAIRISATFKIAVTNCNDPNAEVGKPSEYEDDDWLHRDHENVIVSNTWRMTEAKDSNWKTTRTIEGEIRTWNRNFVQLHRMLLLPPLLKGYKRVSQNYASDEQGTLMRYAIVDEQAYAAPPAPAIDWSCQHTESTTMMGANQVANIVVKLRGDMDVDKRGLIAAAGKVLSLRLVDLRQQSSNDQQYSSIIQELALVDQVDQPEVTLRATVRYTTSQYTWLAMRIESMMGGPSGNLQGEKIAAGYPDYDAKTWTTPLPYDGDSPQGLLQNYLQSSCTGWHGMIGKGQQPYVYRPETSNKEAYTDRYPIQRLPSLEGDQPEWLKPDSPGNAINNDKYNVYQYPYTEYSFVTTWETALGKMHLPLSGYSANSQEPADGAVVLSMNDGITRLFYEIEATRFGRYPVIPQFNDEIEDENGVTFKLLDRKVVMRPAEITSDGRSKIMGIGVSLVYGATKKIPADAILNPGALPFDKTDAKQVEVNWSDIVDSQNRMINNVKGTT
jgi:hypothetical protein